MTIPNKTLAEAKQLSAEASKGWSTVLYTWNNKNNAMAY